MSIRTFVTAALLATIALVSVAPGGAPMGLPTAYLGEGQWGVGAEYGYEEADLTASGIVREHFLLPPSNFYQHQLFEIEDLVSHMAFGTLAYGIGDNWDIFARIGASNATDDIFTEPASPTAREMRGCFDGGFGLAWGVGTRATFYRAGPLSFGGLAQVTWFRPGNSDLSIGDGIVGDERWDGEARLRYWQAQASLAVSYQLASVRLWAGPFLQYVRGDLDFSGDGVIAGPEIRISTIHWTSKVQEATQVGAHVGANWEVCDKFNLWVEGQFTGESYLVGIGAVIIPEKSFGI